MRVLITGDRNWTEYAPVFRVLDILHELHPDAIIVEGGAPGADTIAGEIWTKLSSVYCLEVHKADWGKHGRSAGPIRNRFMVKESQRRAELDGHRLEYAVAFHHDLLHSRGTRDMVSVLESAGIPVLKVG